MTAQPIVLGCLKKNREFAQAAVRVLSHPSRVYPRWASHMSNRMSKSDISDFEWERVWGERGSGLSIERNPGSHLTMRPSRSTASAFFFTNGRRRRPTLSHKGPMHSHKGEVA